VTGLQRIALICALAIITVGVGISVAAVSSPSANIGRLPGIPAPTTAAIAQSNAAPQPAAANTLPSAAPASGAALPATNADATAAATTSPPDAEKDSAASLAQRVAQALDDLHSGELSATLDYGQGDGSLSQVRFDLGDGQSPASFAQNTTYAGVKGRRSDQRITVGAQSWQRVSDGSWAAGQATETVPSQLKAFLPDPAMIVDARVTLANGRALLEWRNPRDDSAVTLYVDPNTGIPLQLRQQTGASSTVFTVTYSSWNAPVQIAAPA
jgi:hypothetical protein